MESLNGVIQSLKLPAKLKETLEIFSIVKHNWGKILEEKANCAYPFKFEEGVLYIVVEDHYELQNLNSNYLSILKRVNGFLKVKNLSSTVRTIKFLYHPDRKNSEIEKFREDSPLEEEAWRVIEKNISQVFDEELKGAFLKLLRSYRQAQKRVKGR